MFTCAGCYFWLGKQRGMRHNSCPGRDQTTRGRWKHKETINIPSIILELEEGPLIPAWCVHRQTGSLQTSLVSLRNVLKPFNVTLHCPKHVESMSFFFSLILVIPDIIPESRCWEYTERKARNSNCNYESAGLQHTWDLHMSLRLLGFFSN